MKTINLFVDDARTPTIPCGNSYYPNPKWVVSRTIEDTKTLLQAGIVNDLDLDYDMNDSETGLELLFWCEKMAIWPVGIISVHTANDEYKQMMFEILKRNGR
jgi:hypothetical protein